MGYERTVIQQAITYLQERGVWITYFPKNRCWYTTLKDIDWRKLQLGQLEDLGLLPDDEAVLLQLVLSTSPYVAKKVPNPAVPPVSWWDQLPSIIAVVLGGATVGVLGARALMTFGRTNSTARWE